MTDENHKPVSDIYQAIADKANVTRAEAKAAALMYMYSFVPMSQDEIIARTINTIRLREACRREGGKA